MLAVTSAVRSTLLPNVPTIAEAALPGFEAVLRYGLVAPPGTPRAIIERLNAALNAALQSEARMRSREDFKNMPPFVGEVTHQACEAEILF